MFAGVWRFCAEGLRQAHDPGFRGPGFYGKFQSLDFGKLSHVVW